MPFLSSLCIYSCLMLKFACLKSAFFEGGGSFCLFLVFCTDVCWWGLRKIPARPVGPHLLSHSTGKEGGPLWRQQWLWLIIKRKKKKAFCEKEWKCVCVCLSFFFFFLLFIFLYAHNANWLKSSCKGLASTLRPVLLYCLHWDSSLLLIISCIFFTFYFSNQMQFVSLPSGALSFSLMDLQLLFRPGVLVDRCLCTVMLLALFCTSWGSKSGL